MIIRPYLLFICFNLAHCCLIAQNNTIPLQIFTKNGDTLNCKLKDYPSDGWEYEPKSIKTISSGGQEIEYTPKDIRGFLIPSVNKLFQSAIVDVNNEPIDEKNLNVLSSPNEIHKLELEKKEVFLHVITKGKLNLYEYYDKNRKYHYFISTDNDSIETLIYRKVIIQTATYSKLFIIDTYKEQLRKAVADCSIKDNFSLLKYNKTDLLKIVAAYNTCSNVTYFVEKKQKSYFTVSVFSGITNPLLTTQEEYLRKYTFVNYGKPILGAGINMPFLRNNKKFALGVEGTFLKYNFQERIDYAFVNDEIEVKYNMTGIRLNISMTYTTGNNADKFRKFFKIGLGGGGIFNGDFRYNYYKTGDFNRYSYIPVYVVDYISLVGGAGLVYKNWFAELHYERSSQNLAKQRVLGGDLASIDYFSLRLGRIINVYSKK